MKRPFWTTVLHCLVAGVVFSVLNSGFHPRRERWVSTVIGLPLGAASVLLCMWSYNRSMLKEQPDE